jgi:2'-5' RNA ligase
MHIYDQLWKEGTHALERGEPRLDPHLLQPSADRRRGVSINIRLNAAVRSRISHFANQLAAEFPEQYFYRPDELHVTVLTLISATELWRREIREVAAFRRILGDILGRHQSFDLQFRGVTAAANAVLVQGFPVGDGLESIRAGVRRAFAENGLADRLDRRYRNEAAHVTLMRFRKPEADWRRLLSLVRANRQTDFGESRVEALELVFCDWYASSASLRVLQKFPLMPARDDCKS